MKGLDYSKFNVDDHRQVEVEMKGNEPASYDWKDNGAVTNVKNQVSEPLSPNNTEAN